MRVGYPKDQYFVLYYLRYVDDLPLVLGSNCLMYAVGLKI